MWWSRRAVLGLGLAALGGCSFRPLYGERPGAARELAAIAVGPLPDRLGQIVRGALIDRLSPAGEPARPRYRLDLELVRTSAALAIQPDATTTRFNLRLDVRFTLVEIASGTTLYQDRSRAIASYNAVRSDFATLAAEKDSERRAAAAVSDEIASLLTVFFANRGVG